MARIVVAEPDPDGGPLLAEALRAAGHDVRLASDAYAAVTEAVTLSAEILVLSTTLPKGRASAVVQEVRRAGVRPRRIVALSRHRDPAGDFPEASARISWPLAAEDLAVVIDGN